VVRRSWVIRAVPAAAMTSAPAMAAISRATARGQAGVRAEEADVHGVGVLMMKITSRMRAPKPAISPMRMLAIRVGRPRRWGAGGGPGGAVG